MSKHDFEFEAPLCTRCDKPIERPAEALVDGKGIYHRECSNPEAVIANLRANLRANPADGPSRKFFQLALLVRVRGLTWQDNRGEIERLRTLTCEQLDAELG